MEQDSKDFADSVIDTPAHQAYRKAHIHKIDVKFDPVTEYDRQTIENMPEYKAIFGQKFLYGIAAQSHILAKAIQMKAGSYETNIHFAPGKNKDEIDMKYTFSPSGYVINFPYINRRHTGVIQGVYTRRLGDDEDKWYQRIASGSVASRLQYCSDFGRNHSFAVVKDWEKAIFGLDSAVKLKYGSKWIDTNVKERVFTKQWKLLHNFSGKESVLFRHNEEIMPPNHVFAKFSHKSRMNDLDTDRCTGELLRTGFYPDSLWSAKFGYKKAFEPERLFSLFKSWTEFGYNKTDNAFAKFKTYLRTNYYWEFMKVNLNNSFIFEKLLAGNISRINDGIFLRGVKGLYEFPGAKSYKDDVIESGKEHVGDRVPNDYIAQWESKIYMPHLAPFKSISQDWMVFMPYVYGTFAYAKPQDVKYRGNKFTDNLRGSTGFGLSLELNPIMIELFYSVGSFKPRSDVGKEYGIYIGID